MSDSIPNRVFWLGAHKFGMGPTPDGSRVDAESHVVPVIKAANELGFGGLDAARLYCGSKNAGRARELLRIDWEQFPLQTKCLRYLGTSYGATEHQPEVLTRCFPIPYNEMTDRWDCSYQGVEAQVMTEMEHYGCTRLAGVALHDPPDKRVQIGLDWQKDLREGALRFLLFARDRAKIIERIGLGVKDPGFVLEFANNEPGVLNYAGITSSPAMMGGLMRIIDRAKQDKFTVCLMGIFFGRAFVLEEDPMTVPNFLFNYEEATAEERQLMHRYWEICQDGKIRLKDLAAACAGSLVRTFPEIVTQVVITSLDTGRLLETVKLVKTATVPKLTWINLKSEDLLPNDFPVD